MERKTGVDFLAVEEGGWPEPEERCVFTGKLVANCTCAKSCAVENDGYDSLRQVFLDAVEQAAHGKGKERHAREGEAFEDQDIVRIGQDLGSNHFQIGQARKKAQESLRLPPDRARIELLGAINYLAAAYMLVPKS